MSCFRCRHALTMIPLRMKSRRRRSANIRISPECFRHQTGPRVCAGRLKRRDGRDRSVCLRLMTIRRMLKIWKAGRISLLFGQGAEYQGYRPLYILYDYVAKGLSPTESSEYIEPSVVTKYNLRGSGTGACYYEVKTTGGIVADL